MNTVLSIIFPQEESKRKALLFELESLKNTTIESQKDYVEVILLDCSLFSERSTKVIKSLEETLEIKLTYTALEL